MQVSCKWEKGVRQERTLPIRSLVTDGFSSDIFISRKFMFLFLSVVMTIHSHSVVAANGQEKGKNSLINAKLKHFLSTL